MPYIEEKCYAGDTIEIRKYYSSRYKVKGIKRSENKKPTVEEQKVVNSKRAEKELRRIINTNFKEGDYHLVLTYRKEDRTEDKEEIKKQMAKFVRGMREEYKKQGLEFKYVHVAEVGERGALHHHLVVNAIDPKVINKLWKYGRVKINLLDETGQYKKLASYLIKYTDKVIGTEREIYGKRWNSSKNLEKPRIKKRIVSSKRGYNAEAREIKGYYIDKETVKSGISVFSGFPYYEYTLVKIKV